MRACLFQSSNRQRLADLLSSAATDTSRRALLESRAAVELAAQAAVACRWDQCALRAPMDVHIWAFALLRQTKWHCLITLWALRRDRTPMHQACVLTSSSRESVSWSAIRALRPVITARARCASNWYHWRQVQGGDQGRLEADPGALGRTAPERGAALGYSHHAATLG